MPLALITGANRGLGLEFTRQYLRDGWRVIGSCRNPDAASDLATSGAEVMKLDVTRAADVTAASNDWPQRASTSSFAMPASPVYARRC